MEKELRRHPNQDSLEKRTVSVVEKVVETGAYAAMKVEAALDPSLRVCTGVVEVSFFR